MSTEIEPITIELELELEKQDAESVVESINKIVSVLTVEQLEATSSFIFNHPDAVIKIERYIENPPIALRPVINMIKGKD